MLIPGKALKSALPWFLLQSVSPWARLAMISLIHTYTQSQGDTMPAKLPWLMKITHNEISRRTRTLEEKSSMAAHYESAVS